MSTSRCTVCAARKTNAIASSVSPPSIRRSAALKLVLQSSGLDENTRSLINDYLNSTPDKVVPAIPAILLPTGMGDKACLSGRPKPLNDFSGPRPHALRLWSRLYNGKGATEAAPPVLTPPTSPVEVTASAEFGLGSKVLLFDDGGALVYHLPETNVSSSAKSIPSYLARPLEHMYINPILGLSTSSHSVGTTNRTRTLAFDPMTPIAECSEYPDLLSTPCASPAAPPESEYSLSTMSSQVYDWEDLSRLGSVDSLASATEYHLGGSESNDDLILPNPYNPESSDTVKLISPRPSRNRIDRAQFQQLLSFTEIDSGKIEFSFSAPSLEQCSTSGNSSLSGILTPVGPGFDNDGAAVACDSSSSSTFGAIGAALPSYKSKESPLFSSLLYIGKPEFDRDTQSVFEPFGADEDTFEDVQHVGVDIVNELLAADDYGVPDIACVSSPFDCINDAIHCHPPATTGQRQPGPKSASVLFDLTDLSEIGDTVFKTSVVVDTPVLPDPITLWIDSNLDRSGDSDTSDGTSSGHDEDEDTFSFILEHGGIKYTVCGELGQGSYGQVVLAYTSLGEQVAIKICGKAREGNAPADLRRAILNERNTLVRMSAEDDAFLTQPLACFQDADNVYFVLVSP